MHHVVINNLILDNYVEVSKHSKLAYIYCANGSKLRIFGTGDIGRHIRGVFYVPGASVNIISVSQLTKGGHLVTFTETSLILSSTSNLSNEFVIVTEFCILKQNSRIKQGRERENGDNDDDGDENNKKKNKKINKSRSEERYR